MLQVPLREPAFNNNTDMECPRIIQKEVWPFFLAWQ
jgi:hypothetical protein